MQPILLSLSTLLHAQPCSDGSHSRPGEFPTDYHYVDPWTFIDTCEYPVFSPTLAGLRTQCSMNELPSRLARGVNATLECVKDQVAFNGSSASDSLGLGECSITSDMATGMESATYTSNGTRIGTGSLLLVILVFILALVLLVTPLWTRFSGSALQGWMATRKMAQDSIDLALVALLLLTVEVRQFQYFLWHESEHSQLKGLDDLVMVLLAESSTWVKDFVIGTRNCILGWPVRYKMETTTSKEQVSYGPASTAMSH